MPDDELNGWKEIAAHLGKAVRTAQRWEQNLGLPVHRIQGAAGEVIFARVSELDDWKRKASRTKAGQHELDASDGAADRSPAPVAPAARRPRSALWAISLAAAGLMVAAVWLLGWPTRPLGRADLAADGYTGREGLDKGPWPICRHDVRRTGQSHLSGPIRPRTPWLLFESPVPFSWDESRTGADQSDIVATSTGALVSGGCGGVTAIDLAGRQLWRRPLATTPVQEGVAGLAADAVGAVIVATHECPVKASRTLRLYGLDPRGEVLWARPQWETERSPVVAADGSIYTVSDWNVVARYTRVLGESAWKVDLPGYGHGYPAVDASGSVYVATDGSYYHQPSLWSLTPDGRVRWSAGAGALSTPAILPDGRIVVVDNGGDRLYCYRSDGGLAWSAVIGSTFSSVAPVAVGRSGTIYVRTVSGLSAIDAGGTIRWATPSSDGPAIAPGPVLDKDENVYVGLGNRVCSFTPTGARRWCEPLDDPGTMIVAADGVLCVVGRRTAIYVLQDAAQSGGAGVQGEAAR